MRSDRITTHEIPLVKRKLEENETVEEKTILGFSEDEEGKLPFDSLRCVKCNKIYWNPSCPNCDRDDKFVRNRWATKQYAGAECRNCGTIIEFWVCPDADCQCENPLINSMIKIIKPSSGGCFIATSVYGDYNSIEVKKLRDFRNNILLHHYLGKLFVKIYVKVSPVIANHLSKKTFLKNIVKRILDVIVSFLS